MRLHIQLISREGTESKIDNEYIVEGQDLTGEAVGYLSFLVPIFTIGGEKRDERKVNQVPLQPGGV